jgi:sigma-B regulation protein RsbU (phosphoserine phosphatase)
MKVLLADDDRIAVEMLKRQLEDLGYEVVCAMDGKEAMQQFQSQPFSIVISDWMMPEMDGLELLRNIRRSASQYVYFILLTVKDRLDELVQGMEAGADDFLTKPPDPNELRVRLAAGKRIIELERRLSDSNSRMQRELQAAARIQRSLLPSKSDFKRNRFAWKYSPCYELGGDILNVISLGQHKVAFYVLDVAGKGVSAALLSVALSRLLTTATNASSIIRDRIDSSEHYRIVEPSEVLTRLNDRFCGDLVDGQFFTMMYGVLDLHTRQFTYASGGHDPALLLSGDGSVRKLGSTGPIVGILDDQIYEQITVDMKPRDRLLVYSDGITDAINSDGDQFGIDRLIEFVRLRSVEPVQTLLDTLVKFVEDWSNPHVIQDDVSCLLAEAVE